MAAAGDRILLVEHDPHISDVIGRQTLLPVGYHVDLVTDSSAAIRQALLAPPDLILADLNLPGLSAKDMLVAFAAQGIATPALVIARKGQEEDIIQAFRLGAADYLLWPAREAEVLSAVERLLRRVHELRDRQRLELRLREAQRDLAWRERQLEVLTALGRAVVSITDQPALFQEFVHSLIQVAQADRAWLLIRNEESGQFLLAAERGLPEGWARRIHRSLDDGLSPLVALSGETLSISGEPLLRFRVARLGRSACVVPIKARSEVIGMSLVVRRDGRPFEKMEQTLLEAISDSISLSLLNARLFRALEPPVPAWSEGPTREKYAGNSAATGLQSVIDSLNFLLADTTGPLTESQRRALESARTALSRPARTVGKPAPPANNPLKKK